MIKFQEKRKVVQKRVVSNIVSTLFGKFASKRFHPILQKFINKSYVRFMNLDMSDFEKPSSYKSLNELFTRSLKKSRNIEDGIIAPCDGLITECGRVEFQRAYQIKGMAYRIDELLKECDTSKLENGEYINFYLSPRDYHRYHMPYDLQILRVIHIPGKLYPVNLAFLKRKLNLFIENERVIIECLTKSGKRVYIVLVGALNVGQMTLVFEKRIETNKKREVSIFEYSDLFLKKGELLGYFKMGSTIVLFFEKDFCRLTQKSQNRVKYGQTVAKEL